MNVCLLGKDVKWYHYLVTFYLPGFLSETVAIHETLGEGRDNFYFSLSPPPTHEHSEIYLQL